jgi:predicted protein tyrosine phosphatase
MIHVCSLARLHDTVHETGARHIITLLRMIDRVERPATVVADNHLILGMDDIVEPIEGYTHPGEEHVTRLIEFVTRWDRTAPMVIHCYAGISRSTAGAFVAACALNPSRNEAAIAQAIRNGSATATPNMRIVTLADQILGRGGRMVGAIRTIGVGRAAMEGDPFRLDIE